VPDSFLVEHGVGEWMELPLWIHDPEEAGMLDAIVARALEGGLTFRPLEDTVRDTLEQAEPAEGVGLTPEREAELLAGARS
jgi:2'-hydroxyisoflavone reductase